MHVRCLYDRHYYFPGNWLSIPSHTVGFFSCNFIIIVPWYNVTFTKVVTIYHSWIRSLHHGELMSTQLSGVSSNKGISPIISAPWSCLCVNCTNSQMLNGINQEETVNSTAIPLRLIYHWHILAVCKSF
jgi:hypothetical protein